MAVALAVLDGDVAVEDEVGEGGAGALAVGLLGLGGVYLGETDLLGAGGGFDDDGVAVDHPRDGSGELGCPATPAEEEDGYQSR